MRDKPNNGLPTLAVVFSILLEGVPHDALIQDNHSKMDRAQFDRVSAPPYNALIICESS